jgi:long-subunit fatty acid transport protein
MRTRKWLALAVGAAPLLVGLSAGTAAAQDATTGKVDNIGYGTRAGEFLLLPVGARAAAMGQAFSALADDATALYWNPAGISFLGQRSIHVTHLDYLAETSYTWGGLAVPLGVGTWVVGAQLGGFNFGEAPVYTIEEPEGTGSTYSNSMFVVGGTVAMNVTDRFSFGGSVKYVQESLANTSGSTLALDIGSNYHTEIAGRPFRAAFSILNLGGEIAPTGSDLVVNVPNPDPRTPDRTDQAVLRTQSFPLPVMFKVGLGWDALSTPNGRLTVAGEFWQPQQNNTSTAVGLEYTLRPEALQGVSFSLRGGYTYEPDRSYEAGGINFDDEASDGVAFGGGILYQPSETGFGLGIDYAYRQLGLLGNVNMFSLSLRW